MQRRVIPTADYKTFLLFLAIASVINYAFRQLPFSFFRKGKIPAVIRYLGAVLPMAIMCILVLYCIRSTEFSAAGSWLPQIAALAVTAALHLWKRNSTLSIFGGTACYMILLRIL